MFLENVICVLLKEKIADVEAMKNCFCMIIKMCSIALIVIFAIIENAKEFFWDACVEINNV